MHVSTKSHAYVKDYDSANVFIVLILLQFPLLIIPKSIFINSVVIKLFKHIFINLINIYD